MKIYNQTKTQEIFNPDLTKGYLKPEKLYIRTEPAVTARSEQGHYETIAEYPETGGKEIRWVIDTPAVESREAKAVYEDIQVYIAFTAAHIEAQNKAKRSRYIDAYRKYQAAVNYGEFLRISTVEIFMERLRNKDWTAFDMIPPQLKYFMGEASLAESGLVRSMGG